MLGGSEFRLRRGFACGKTLVRRKGAAGQKTGWTVSPNLFDASNQNAVAGLRFGAAAARRFYLPLKNIDFSRPFQKGSHLLSADGFFVFQPPGPGRLPASHARGQQAKEKNRFSNEKRFLELLPRFELGTSSLPTDWEDRVCCFQTPFAPSSLRGAILSGALVSIVSVRSFPPCGSQCGSKAAASQPLLLRRNRTVTSPPHPTGSGRGSEPLRSHRTVFRGRLRRRWRSNSWGRRRWRGTHRRKTARRCCPQSPAGTPGT